MLFLGPRPSHISDLLDKHGIGIQVTHGNAQAMLQVIEQFRAMPIEKRTEMGQEAQRVLGESLSQKMLCGKLCDAVEKALRMKS
jgi:colanic acid biosynthesis glycosyl transferase WcaI